MKDIEFKQLIIHYFRNSFDKFGISKKAFRDANKADNYIEDEWNQLANYTGVEKSKLRRWRSEYDRFKNAFEALRDLSKVGGHTNLVNFIEDFFKLTTHKNEDCYIIKNAHWAYKIISCMNLLNKIDFENRIKLKYIIIFICEIDNSELRDEIIQLLTKICQSLENPDLKYRKKILNLIEIFKNTF